jgi:fucose 4-O-acetylase-like acetyltransferase
MFLKERDYYFDNARSILIFFVIFGHCLEYFILTDYYPLAETFYWWIYTFHMPAFIFISGYFAKNYQKKGYFHALFYKTLVPGWIFSLVYGVLNQHIHSWQALNPLIGANWISWFMFSLFTWNVFLLLFGKYPILFPLSIVFALAAGYLDEFGYYFSLYRSFFFLPFFLLGYYFNRVHITRLLNVKLKPIFLLLVFCVWLLTKKLQLFNVSFSWFYGGLSNEFLQISDLKAVVVKLMVYGIMVSMMYTFLAFVPQKKMYLTYVGQYTIYIYLLHGVFVKLVMWKRLFIYEHTLTTIVCMAVFSFSLLLLLSSEWVRNIASPLIEFKLQKNAPLK